MVVMDVPPFCMANGDRARLVGLNAVGLERRGLAAEQVAVLRRAYKILFQSKLLARDAVERIGAAARKAGKPIAVFVGGKAEAAWLQEQGATTFVVSSDQGFMRRAAAQALTEIGSLRAKTEQKA